MVEKTIWFNICGGRDLGVDGAQEEPSHIHIPRPSRVRRPDGTGNGATWLLRAGDQEYSGLAQLASQEDA